MCVGESGDREWLTLPLKARDDFRKEGRSDLGLKNGGHVQGRSGHSGRANNICPGLEDAVYGKDSHSQWLHPGGGGGVLLRGQLGPISAGPAKQFAKLTSWASSRQE